VRSPTARPRIAVGSGPDPGDRRDRQPGRLHVCAPVSSSVCASAVRAPSIRLGGQMPPASKLPPSQPSTGHPRAARRSRPEALPGRGCAVAGSLGSRLPETDRPPPCASMASRVSPRTRREAGRPSRWPAARPAVPGQPSRSATCRRDVGRHPKSAPARSPAKLPPVGHRRSAVDAHPVFLAVWTARLRRSASGLWCHVDSDTVHLCMSTGDSQIVGV